MKTEKKNPHWGWHYNKEKLPKNKKHMSLY